MGIVGMIIALPCTSLMLSYYPVSYTHLVFGFGYNYNKGAGSAENRIENPNMKWEKNYATRCV